MPAYFSMTLLFDHKRIKPNFVKEIYSQIITFGFGFKSGYWFHEEVNLEKIIEWNQKLLEKKFRLGFTQHVKHDYMQIIFQAEFYSELRGFWMYSDEQVTFDLIIPEHDIINYEFGSYFIKNKITPMKELATKLWELEIVDVIQTSIELDTGYYALSNVLAGKNISVNPFAILPESAILNFSSDYLCGIKTYKVKNKGVLIETDGTI